MKTTLIASLMAVAILFAFSGCESTKESQSSGTHKMGSPKSPYLMSNEDMQQQKKH